MRLLLLAGLLAACSSEKDRLSRSGVFLQDQMNEAFAEGTGRAVSLEIDGADGVALLMPYSSREYLDEVLYGIDRSEVEVLDWRLGSSDRGPFLAWLREGSVVLLQELDLNIRFSSIMSRWDFSTTLTVHLEVTCGPDGERLLSLR